MDKSILFKINSETDMQELVLIINTAHKRLNNLKIFKLLPKVEVVEKPIEEVKILEKIEVPNEKETVKDSKEEVPTQS